MEVVSGTREELGSKISRAVGVFRRRVFVEQLGWNIPIKGGEEQDQFDRADTVYILMTDGGNETIGCARLLCTERDYLLSEVFPQLVPGLPPRSKKVWELSRFAVTNQGYSRSIIDVEEHTRTLLAACVVCAHQRGAEQLITVSPLGVERLLRRLGVHAHRAGPPSMIDGRPVIACWIEIDHHTRGALMNHSDKPIVLSHSVAREPGIQHL